jgi:hypothetical protein
MAPRAIVPEAAYGNGRLPADISASCTSAFGRLASLDRTRPWRVTSDPKPPVANGGLVRGDDEQILFMLRESYGSHAA